MILEKNRFYRDSLKMHAQSISEMPKGQAKLQGSQTASHLACFRSFESGSELLGLILTL